MLEARERAALESARVGRLATADAEGRPRAVPVCYALVDAAAGPPRLVTPIDEKPKAAAPRALGRVRDVLANPRAALVVDRYDEDWDRLWWVLVRGTAAVLEPEDEGHDPAVRALRARYDQYGGHALESRPAIAVTPGSVRSWGALPAVDG